MDISGNVGLLNSNIQQNNGLFGQPNPNDPQQTALYYEKKFSDIFSSFLSTSSSSDEGDLTGSSSSDELDFLGNTSANSSSSSDSYLQLAQMSANPSQFLGTQNLDLMNQAAAIIGKQAIYVQSGVQHSGLVQSVVNENGVIAFRIDGELVPMQSIQEITGGSNA